MRRFFLIYLLFFILSILNAQNAEFTLQDPYQGPEMFAPPLSVSSNNRYLVNSDKKPAYLIGGTAWTMPENCTSEDVDYYLSDRKAKGFNYVQIVAVRDFGGQQAIEDQKKNGTMNPENRYGHRPFEWKNEKADVSKPIVVEGGTPTEPNDYWDHLDYIVEKTYSMGMYLGLLPAWGKYYINNPIQEMRIIDESTAYGYGLFLGERYRERDHIIWILGGDVWNMSKDMPDGSRPVYRKMAEGIAKGVTGDSPAWDQSSPAWENVMITYHVNGVSSEFFNDDAWLRLNMIEQSDPNLYESLSTSYNNIPVRPLIHGEGWYEGWVWNDEYITAQVIRRQMYHFFFGGGLAGITYGVAQTHKAGNDQLLKFPPGWRDRLDLKGALAVRHLRTLLDQRKWWELEPDQSIIASGGGSSETLKAACKSSAGNEILVFFAENKPAQIDLTGISTHDKAKAVWFDPRNGNIQEEGAYSTNQVLEFSPPENWEDAVLILEGVMDEVHVKKCLKGQDFH